MKRSDNFFCNNFNLNPQYIICSLINMPTQYTLRNKTTGTNATYVIMAYLITYRLLISIFLHALSRSMFVWL